VGGVPLSVDGLDRPREPKDLVYRGVTGQFRSQPNPAGGESSTVTFSSAAEDNLFWAGAPVLDARRNVVAVYSGFVDNDPNAPQGPKSHDVVSTKLLAELLR
jgi:hypothetical protein